MSIRILQGDVFAKLAELPDNYFDCVCTSPPYWNLRDYGVIGQIGMEPTVDGHIAVLVAVFREVRRVLKPTGCVFLNYGDCYATTPNGRSAADTRATGNDDRTFRDKPFSTIQGVMKPKDLCLIPQRLAIALQVDGWWIRSLMPWVKRNGMPESITDRPATSIEYIIFMTKSERYAYDAEAVRKAAAPSSIDRISQDVESQIGSERANGGRKTNGPMKAVMRGSDKQRGHGRRHAGFNDRWDQMERDEQIASGRNFRNSDLFFESLDPPFGLISDGDGLPIAIDANPQGFSGLHFATFPVKLVEPLLKAGAPSHGCCRTCGAPWRRIVEKGDPDEEHRRACGADASGGYDGVATKDFASAGAQDASATKARILEGMRERITTGWEPRCKCEQIFPLDRPRVLDCFGGAFTTMMVADRLGLDATGIELNQEYVQLATNRLRDDAGMFADITIKSSDA